RETGVGMGSLVRINAISLIVAFASFVGAYLERVRKTTLTWVEWLLSDRTQRARSVVGRFARRSETLNNEEKREFTDAVFSLLWSIQHADLASSFIKKPPSLRSRLDCCIGNLKLLCLTWPKRW